VSSKRTESAAHWAANSWVKAHVMAAVPHIHRQKREAEVAVDVLVPANATDVDAHPPARMQVIDCDKLARRARPNPGTEHLATIGVALNHGVACVPGRKRMVAKCRALLELSSLGLDPERPRLPLCSAPLQPNRVPLS